MTQTIEFEGKQHQFPDDASKDDIARALAGHSGKPISQVGALMEGVKAGATANLSDELSGLYAASGSPKMLEGLDPKARPSAVGTLLGMIVGGGRLAYEKLVGGEGDATKVYEEARDVSRERQKAAQEQYPKTFIGGEVGGALALPGSLAAQAASLPARILRGGLTGVVQGGMAGFGAGEGAPESAVKAGIGAGAGGIVGMAAPPLVEGAVRGGAMLAQPLVSAVRGAATPESEAARQVVTAIERDIKADPAAKARLTPGEFQAAQSEGQPVSVMEMGGGLTRRLADVAGITSPEASTTLNRAINERFESQKPRIAQWLRETFHYPDAAAQERAIEQTAQTVNRARYASAMRDPNAQSMWDEGFQQLTAAPAVREAIRAASTSGANRAAAQGFRPPVNPFEFAADGTMTMKQGVTPSLQFWDQVGKNLRGMIGRAKRAGDDTLVSEVQPLRRALLNHLDELVPAYREARSGAAHFFGAENALEAGQNFVGASQHYGIPAARDALAMMSPQERQLFQDGYVSRLIEAVEKTPDRRSTLNQISQSAAAKQEIRLAIGEQRAKELEAMLRVEGVIDLARTAVQGNSWTARRLYDLGLAGGAGLGLHGYDLGDPKEMAIGGLMAAFASGGKAINRNVMRQVAELLTSNDPTKLQRGVQIISRNNRLLEGLRAADMKLARIGGQQSGNVPALQAAGVGRADQDQPNIPRPPGQ